MKHKAYNKIILNITLESFVLLGQRAAKVRQKETIGQWPHRVRDDRRHKPGYTLDTAVHGALLYQRELETCHRILYFRVNSDLTVLNTQL